MNRLYVVETMPTVTGFKAEHRLALKPSEIVSFATALAGGSASAAQNPSAEVPDGSARRSEESLGGKVRRDSGRAGFGSGSRCGVCAECFARRVGKTVVYTETVNPMPSEQGCGSEVAGRGHERGQGAVAGDAGREPALLAPADLNFADAFNKVPTTVHLGTHVDETGFFRPGTSTRRTTWRAGRMRARMTARSRSFSR
jgi:hypothetical protein